MLKLCHGAPAEKRAENEQAVYDFLDRHGIPFTRVDHPAVHTMEECIESADVLQVDMCKNLFLCNSQKTKFYLLLLPGNKPFKTKVFSKMMEVSRLSFAPADKIEEYLHISPGAVSPMGLLFESARDVTLVMDIEVKKQTLFGCHPCVNTASIAFPMEDLLNKFLPAAGHQITFVNLPWEVE